MKVLAINGSPRVRSSSTYHILVPLVEGMRAAGAETSLIHVRELELKPCLGCFHCWVQTPGECVHEDGMRAALEAYTEADLVVYGTPLYHGSMSGLLKTFLDRLLPRHEPWLIPSPHVAGMSGHPSRWAGPRGMLLVSACGFPEFENFDALVYTFRHMARLHGQDYVGEILRPFGEPLSRKALQGLFGAYYEVVYRAGEEVVNDWTISAQTQEALREDLLPGDKQAKYELANAFWEQRMVRGQETCAE
jgi:NAD(P)H-dependent FMN reductase